MEHLKIAFTLKAAIKWIINHINTNIGIGSIFKITCNLNFSVEQAFFILLASTCADLFVIGSKNKLISSTNHEIWFLHCTKLSFFVRLSKLHALLLFAFCWCFDVRDVDCHRRKAVKVCVVNYVNIFYN